MDGVMIIKPVVSLLEIRNMVRWVVLHVVRIRPGLYLEHAQGSQCSWMPDSSSWRQVCGDLGSNILVLCWSYNYPALSNYCQWLHGHLGNQVHPAVQILFPNNDANVQSWFEEHEDALQHLPWPARSPDLNIIQSLWSGWEDFLLHHVSINWKMFFMKDGTLFC
jgi:hypothetical protein